MDSRSQRRGVIAAISRDLHRFLVTASYLRPFQLFARAKRSFRRKLHRVDRFASIPPSFHPTRIRFPLVLLDRGSMRKSGRVFRFLNREIDCSSTWFPGDGSALWLYNLHYCAWLQQVHDSREQDELILDWITNVPPGHSIAWHPYPVSLRICNWTWFLSSLQSASSNTVFAESLYSQLQFLSRNLEYDVLGNHLIENAKALVVGGAYFGSQTEIELGLKVLREQLAEQVLSDGGHYERSPMYHAIVLADLLAVGFALCSSDHTVPRWLSSVLENMAAFLRGIMEDDGSLPLFNDSADRIAPDPIQLVKCTAEFLTRAAVYDRNSSSSRPAVCLRGVLGCSGDVEADDGGCRSRSAGNMPVSRWSGRPSGDAPLNATFSAEQDADHGRQLPPARCDLFPDFGLFVHRSPRRSLTFDCGAICPDFLPAHAHNDMLSYTLRLAGTSVVSDSGVFEYRRGMWREYFRSTAAHSTVMIDDEEQNDTWASFRVARRGYPHSLEVASDRSRVRCGTTCYRHRGVSIVRGIELLEPANGISVTDTIESPVREATFTEYIQLAPGISVAEKRHDGEKYLLRLTSGAGALFDLTATGAVDIALSDGWESREFGQMSKRVRVELRGICHRGKSAVISYSIVECTNAAGS